MITDLTQGKPLQRILAFAMPMALSTFAQLLYNIGDMAVVGRTLGQNALGAVGACGAPIFMLLYFFTGLVSGMTVITSQRFGASDGNSMRRSVTVCFVISTVVSIAGSIVMCLFCDHILRWMNTPEELFKFSRIYMLVILGGTVTTCWACLTNGILRALGDSMMPLVITIISAILNILLDLLFINVFHWGIGGAAFATQLVQLISAGLCVLVMRRYSILHLKRSDWHLKWKFTVAHWNIGLPVAFQNSLIGIGIVILQRVLNGFGSTVVASVTMGNKIELISVAFLFAIANAIITFAGQNYGARRFDRIQTGIRQSFIFLCIFAVVMWFVLQLIAYPVACLFLGSVPKELMQYIRTYLHITPSFHIFLAAICVYRYALQGMGFTKIALIASIAELIARSAGAPVLAHYFGFKGACFADPCAWIASVLILLPYYFFKMRNLKQKQKIKT